MKNIKFTISYNGKNYHGFQIQSNGITIQQELESALNKILFKKISITGCSRTDSGVHAKEFCFNARIESGIPINGLKNAMNALLPKDIAVNFCEEVPLDFHSRYDTKSKEYLYLVYNREIRDVFLDGLALYYPFKLDVGLMNKTAKIFIGEHDFAAFCKAEAKLHLKSTVREIISFEVKKNREFIEFYIQGTGFLHNMVRILTGTLIYVSEGKRNESDIIEAFKTGNREKAGKTLPPCGLYLNKVYY